MTFEEIEILLSVAVIVGNRALDLKGTGDAEKEAEYKRLWALREELLKLRGEE